MRSYWRHNIQWTSGDRQPLKCITEETTMTNTIRYWDVICDNSPIHSDVDAEAQLLSRSTIALANRRKVIHHHLSLKSTRLIIRVVTQYSRQSVTSKLLRICFHCTAVQQWVLKHIQCWCDYEHGDEKTMYLEQVL